jgi:hypothetical protein
LIKALTLLADRLQYAALCGGCNAVARGEARTKIEATLLPTHGSANYSA